MTVDGISPGRIVSPETLDELSESIASQKGSIVPVGAGTQLEFGNPLQSADCVVSLARLNRITTYQDYALSTLREIKQAFEVHALVRGYLVGSHTPVTLDSLLVGLRAACATSRCRICRFRR